MRIALFHNLFTGGGKRHLFEQARELAARGHELHLFALKSAAAGETEGEGEYLPIAPLCHKTHLYGENAPVSAIRSESKAKGAEERGILLKKAKSLPLAREILDILWSQRMERTIARLAEQYSQIASDIDSGGFDTAYVHHCVVTLAPDLLRKIKRTPTVFCCNDTQRSAMQWPVETDPGYDSPAGAWLQKRRRGRLLGPAQYRFIERLESRFVASTRAATLVLANSWYSRETLALGTGINARVCYPGVDTDFFTPCSDSDTAGRTPLQKTILSVGALLPTKRHEFVLEAVAAIPLSKRPRLEIIGYAGGPHSEAMANRLLARARETGVDLMVRKQVNDTELRAAYQQASAVAFAPYLEPLGLTALEAMACGTPVVGVREAGVRETVTHNKTGLLTSLDKQEFSEALLSLLTNPDLAATLGRQARLDTENRWTWRHSTNTLENLLVLAASENGGNSKTVHWEKNPV